MGLLFMAAISASTIGIASVVRSSLQQTKNIDDYIVASLAADSGLERGLAVVYSSRNLASVQLSEALPCVSTDLSAPCNVRGTLPSFSNNSRVSVQSAETIEPIKRKLLKANETLSFDLIKLGTTAAPRYIKVSGCAPTPASCPNLLEVGWSVLEPSSTGSFSNREILSSTDYQASTKCIDLTNVRSESADTGSPFSGAVLGYRVRIRALQGDVDNITITAHDDLLCTNRQPILSRIKIESTGTAGGTGREVRAYKEANVLWQLPASGVFNYVIFSEENLIP
jgi:hypothetical protein